MSTDAPISDRLQTLFLDAKMFGFAHEQPLLAEVRALEARARLLESDCRTLARIVRPLAEMKQMRGYDTLISALADEAYLPWAEGIDIDAIVARHPPLAVAPQMTTKALP